MNKRTVIDVMIVSALCVIPIVGMILAVLGVLALCKYLRF